MYLIILILFTKLILEKISLLKQNKWNPLHYLSTLAKLLEWIFVLENHTLPLALQTNG